MAGVVAVLMCNEASNNLTYVESKCFLSFQQGDAAFDNDRFRVILEDVTIPPAG